jgi:hypothetical protein
MAQLTGRPPPRSPPGTRHAPPRLPVPVAVARPVAIDKSMRRRGSPADASGGLRQTVFGDAPLNVWTGGAGHPDEPWASFERARQLAQADREDEAVTIWQQIAVTEGLESRHTLQAWHFLRQAGQLPPADRARLRPGTRSCLVPRPPGRPVPHRRNQRPATDHQPRLSSARPSSSRRWRSPSSRFGPGSTCRCLPAPEGRQGGGRLPRT